MNRSDACLFGLQRYENMIFASQFNSGGGGGGSGDNRHGQGGGLLAWSCTNRSLQPDRMARDLKFLIRKWRGCTIYVAIKKGADQLHGYCAADLCLCF